MLTIRLPQLATLGQDVERRFTDDLVARFLDLLPDQISLRQRINDARRRGARYGVRSNDDIEWFVELDLRRGHEWELHPDMSWALDLLSNPAVDLLGRRFRLEKLLRKWDANER